MPDNPRGPDDHRHAELRRLADLLDSRFRIPGTQQRFGLDAIIGLLPGIGDAAGLAAAAVVVAEGVRLGARGWTLASMLVTMVLDATVGSIPVAGTVFDVVYKANSRNVALLEHHLRDEAAARDHARRSVARSLAVVVVVTLLVGVLVLAAAWWVLQALL